jgi:hypothetical protein
VAAPGFAYVTVDDIGARAQLAVKAGGRLLAAPFDVMDAGRMAIVNDPTGGVLALWEPRRQPGAGLIGEPGAFVWVGARDPRHIRSPPARGPCGH